MDEDVIVPGLGSDRQALQQLIVQYGGPAFLKRARRVQNAFDDVLARCRKQRNELLGMVRSRLAALHGLAGDCEALRPYLADDAQVEALRRMHAELRPTPRAPVARTSSGRALRGALAELVESLERFNRRWLEELQKVDLGQVNALREGYNKYYVLEKECVVRSPRLARQGFQPLPPATHADLAALLPPLPVLTLK
jgi:hypothetical protein